MVYPTFTICDHLRIYFSCCLVGGVNSLVHCIDHAKDLGKTTDEEIVRAMSKVRSYRRLENFGRFWDIFGQGDTKKKRTQETRVIFELGMFQSIREDSI